VLNALDWFGSNAEAFDVLLICRGGGSRTDLVWFDSELLGRAVAGFPLPVVIGIGHEQDQSVLDAVGRSCKTPTAAAALLVETVRDNLERCETLGRAVLESASRSVDEERGASRERARRLAFAARHRILAERHILLQRQHRTVGGARTLLLGARNEVSSWSRMIPQHAWRVLERGRLTVEASLRSIAQGARAELARGRDGLERITRSLHPACGRLLEREAERIQGRMQRLRLADPQRVLERGYSVLRLADGGRLVSRVEMAPDGSRVRAQLKNGFLMLRSEGEGGD
jgi:exodeoxyribonuclease VII large subunit